MLSKKYTVKGTHSLRKNDVTALKSAVQNLVGDECSVISEIFEKKNKWSEQIWSLGLGMKVSLYLCEKVPFFVEIKDFLMNDEEDESREFLFFPTIFFFLKFREVFSLESSNNFPQKMGSLLMCRGPTSRFLISGAHLMIPGILRSSLNSSSRLAFIYSVGTPFPYAIGYMTKNLLAGNNNGIGAFILHCYKDCLWSGFYDAYVTDYALCAAHGANCVALPTEFTEKEVFENLVSLQQSESHEIHQDPNAVSNPANVQNTDNLTSVIHENDVSGELDLEGQVVGGVKELVSFSEEEKLMFCFAETLKTVTPTMLPLKVSYFMALFTPNYPRITEDSKPVDFKNTSFKKALTFLQSLEYLTIEETTKGVHSITRMMHRGRLLTEHEEKYRDFLDNVHTPFVERERLTMEQKALETDKVLYEQKLISVELVFKPDKKMNRNLAYVLLLGKEVDDTALFPSLGDKPKVVVPPPADDEELAAAFEKFYSRKQVSDHVDAYIKAKGLLVVDKENPRAVPHVRLDGALIPLLKTTSSSLVPVNQIGQICLKTAFHVIHELIIQTNVKGISDTGASSIPPKRIQKEGPLPIVEVLVEKRGNKKVTVVKNLEAAGFTLKPLCSKWKLQYSTSCLVFDPDDGVERKGGKKHPKEIHIQGSFVLEMKNTMINELGFLPHMVVCR